MKPTRLNVLHVITGLTDGGAEDSLFQLCHSDRDNLHRVVCLMDAGQYGARFAEAGIEVVYLNMPRGRLSLSGLLRLWRTIRAWRPDVVQTWMYHANLIGGVVARLAGIRVICWGIHNTNLVAGTTRSSTIWVAKACGMLSRAVPSLIVSCSQQAVEVHRQMRYAATKFVVVPNGYNLELLAPDPLARARLRAEWGIDESMPLIGMVARYDPQKDHANLIAALAQLARSGWEYRCVLIGVGLDADNAEVVALLKAQGVAEKVILLGRRSDVPAIMNALDIHALSSRYGEAFPNVLSEAMACGTPCVSTNVGDAALIVGETGWIVPSGDSQALADGLGKALEEHRDAVVWQARQAEAHKRVVDSFSIQRMIDGYSASWHQARRG